MAEMQNVPLGQPAGASEGDSSPSSSSATSDNGSTTASPQVEEVVLNVKEADARILEPVPLNRRVTVIVQGLSAWVPASFGPPGLNERLAGFQESATKAIGLCGYKGGDAAGKNGAAADPLSSGKPMRQILFNLNVSCKPGEVLALMGPSGGGKTSLLTVMGGRKPPLMTIHGNTLYNDYELTKENKRRVGFVLQDDLLYEALTVYETLYFAAMLRLPKNLSKAKKVERVHTVITALGLDRCKDTIIGGFFRRGISGGERKRVSVGHELLINPSVLLLDEPTSGLDSTTAMRLLHTLRELAEGHRAVVTTIHQPSSRLYQQLDSLLLLSQGHAMYYGSADKASEWFTSLSCTQPFGINTADFILDCASGEVLAPKLAASGEESRLALVEASEQYLARHKRGYRGEKADAQAGGYSRALGGDGEGGDGQEPPSTSAVHKAPSSMKRMMSRSMTWKEWVQPKDRWGASYVTQLQVLFTRSVKTRRFETLSVQDFVQFLAVGFVTGAVWWQRGDNHTLEGAQDIIGVLFFEGLFLSFRIMFSALFTFPQEYKMMLKERSSGMYRLSAFYFARTASDLPMDWTIPSMFIIMIYWMAWLRPTAGAFFANWSTSMLLQMTAQSFGLLIGTTVMKPKTAQTIAAVIILTFMLIGGFYARNIASWIEWLKYLSFLWYGFNVLNKIQFRSATYYDCGGVEPSDPATDARCTALTGEELTEALSLQRNVDEWPWEVLVLLGYFVLLRIAVYVALRRKTASA